MLYRNIFSGISLKTSWIALIAIAALSGHTSTAQSNSDPAKLQQSALQAIQRYELSLKRTNQLGATTAELQQTESDLWRSADLFLNRGNQAAAIISMYELARLKRWQGDLMKALTFYKVAFDLAQTTGNKNYQIKILVGMSKAAIGVKNDKAAQSFVDQAFTLTAAVADAQTLFDLHDQKRLLLVAHGELAAALDYANRAVKIAEQSGDPDIRLFAYLGRGDVHTERARNCNWMSRTEICLVSYQAAKADLSEAQKQAQTLRYNYLERQAGDSLKVLEGLKVIGATDVAKSVSLPAGVASVDALFHPKTAKEMSSFYGEDFSPGKINFNQVPGGAQAFLNEVRKMPESAEKYAVQGMISISSGDQEAAMKSYLKAVQLIEADRRKLDDSQRSAYLGDKMNTFHFPVLLSLQMKRYAQAFNLMERSRSRVLADQLQSQPLRFATAEERTFYAESSKLNAQIGQAQSQLISEREGRPQPDQERIAELESKIQGLEGEYRNLKERVVASGSKLQELIASRPVALGQFQRLLAQDGSEALIYMVQDAHLVLWHLSSDAVHVRSIGLPRPWLTQKVKSLRDSLASNGSQKGQRTFDRRSARELFLFLIQPALEWIKSDRLVIIPHDELAAVPFQALLNPETSRYLADDFSLSYAPSATVLASLKKPESIRSGRLRVLANPMINESEAQRICAVRQPDGCMISDGLPKRSEVSSLVAGYDLIHFVVHGQFEEQAPMLSYLKFRTDSNGREKLTAAEMFGLPLTGVRLAVLSACESGGTAIGRGGETEGIARALLYAGANNLVLSLWKVDPQPTTIWMEYFYRAGQTMPPREAARFAVAELKKKHPEYSHPWYWTSFIVIGR